MPCSSASTPAADTLAVLWVSEPHGRGDRLQRDQFELTCFTVILKWQNTVYRKPNPSRKTSHEFVYQRELPASGSLDRYGSAIHQSNHAWLTSTRLLMDMMLKVYVRWCPSISISVQRLEGTCSPANSHIGKEGPCSPAISRPCLCSAH